MPHNYHVAQYQTEAQSSVTSNNSNPSRTNATEFTILTASVHFLSSTSPTPLQISALSWRTHPTSLPRLPRQKTRSFGPYHHIRICTEFSDIQSQRHGHVPGYNTTSSANYMPKVVTISRGDLIPDTFDTIFYDKALAHITLLSPKHTTSIGSPPS
ncbi:hypothetical protein BT63DRAFT_458886 [Microthyrium microscopicum]|uniref:Uncharacterized protein n=1 Tax=Microthyrium microscopicum TaxID=703497 RepID=A0A6A6U1J6_9PEZI|nr:hypothetical protein BT63DRAFT_458886 [Microthyrium microscopicum]